jgi:hypothetical protein
MLKKSPRKNFGLDSKEPLTTDTVLRRRNKQIGDIRSLKNFDPSGSRE